jgi:hypothetical protein
MRAWEAAAEANESATLEESFGAKAAPSRLETSSVPWAARDEWQRLQAKHGPLRPLEEALVCRVTACTSVLKLPSERQLGYKGNVINFTNNVALVARQLPLAPKDSGFIFYHAGQRKDSSSIVEKVRKHAIRDYLDFFSRHHKVYVEGIRNPRAAHGSADEWIVPKFKWERDFDEKLWASLPEDGVPDGVVYRNLELVEEEEGDEEAAMDLDVDEGATSPKTVHGSKKVNAALLVAWLQRGDDGRILQRLQLELAASTEALRDDAVLDIALARLFNVAQDEPRPDSTTIASLSAAILELGTFANFRGDRGMLEDLVWRELYEFVCRQDVSFVESGLPHSYEGESGQDPLQERADVLEAFIDGVGTEAISGRGTRADPFNVPRGTVPLSEFKSAGYVAAAFPTLFPFGLGSFSDSRPVTLSRSQWSQHLTHYFDGRFACHDRFRYFMLNTHEREIANEKASLCVRNERLLQHLSVGDVRRLSEKDKEEIARKVETYAATLRNTPAFFKSRRRELKAMIAELGDPHVFATNSHADTHCPYLQDFIKAWASADFEPGGASVDWDARAAGLSDDERYKRRVRNLKFYPHLVALFFHLKTELYVEHICKGILKANAYWMRYEWQARGSTHVHYFLWLSDTPEITSILDRLTAKVAGSILTDGQETSEAQLEELVDTLNAHAQIAAGITRAKQEPGTAPPPDASKDDEALAEAAEYWGARCTRWNVFWDKDRHKPNRATGIGAHACSQEAPSNKLCGACESAADAADIGRQHQSSPRPGSACVSCTVAEGAVPPCKAFVNDIGAIRNTPASRHTNCGPYCQRERNGVVYCRFGFGTEDKQPRDVNDVPYFWCELVKKTVRWRLYLPTNDALMGKQNMWQLASQRSNVDFSPLIDHSCAIEYITK